MDFPNNDDHQYEYGRIGKHYIVVGHLLDDTAKSFSTATIAQSMAMTFPNIRLSLLVGIGGGAPRLGADKEYDIRLGDVVVGILGDGHNGVVQHDYGKFIEPGKSLVVSAKNALIPPSQSVRSMAVQKLYMVVDRTDEGRKQLSEDTDKTIKS
ncbi:hypothetical protein BJ508DRAFT_325706 [Ascobolus immersus RN42]|uniref:Purine and uridine phosphorylase n=1 Tax=Ascobolus immersus RN42 TaxID=1160509 RepID=A0A3N4IBY8_ASCIM|nr:hypothetical protein BJ508DRAFT_325706 [Ascobolus immersus RN42]